MLSLGLIVGCASETDDNASTSDAGGADFGLIGVADAPNEPVKGGVLTYADVTEVRSLDPTLTYATASGGGTQLAAVYDVLVRHDPERQEFVPWLAESLDANEDHTEWTLGLREGVTFSDGTPFDAEAVVGSLDYFIENGGSDAPLLSANIDTYRVEDDRTVVFELNKPWSSFPNMLAQGAGMIVAPAAIAGKEFTPIGAGAFTFDRYRPSEELVLKANPTYWRGKPHLDALRFVVLPSPKATMDSLKNGDVDAALLIYAPEEREAREIGLPGYRDLTDVHPVLWINQREGTAGADLRVRRAIALATDAGLYNQRVDAGEGIVSTSVFPEESRWHSGASAPEIDLAEATALVEEAKADGFDGKLVYVDDSDPRSKNEAVVIESMLERVGFEVETEYASSVADKMQRLYVDHDYDLATGGLGISEADPFHRLHAGLSSTSYSNLTGYADQEMDDLLAELQGATEGAEREAAVRAIEEHWYETVPGVTLGAGAWYVTWQKEVHGMTPVAEFMMLFGEAWIEE